MNIVGKIFAYLYIELICSHQPNRVHAKLKILGKTNSIQSEEHLITSKSLLK